MYPPLPGCIQWWGRSPGVCWAFGYSCNVKGAPDGLLIYFTVGSLTVVWSKPIELLEIKCFGRVVSRSPVTLATF